jgi:hypothetical protein
MTVLSHKWIKHSIINYYEYNYPNICHLVKRLSVGFPSNPPISAPTNPKPDIDNDNSIYIDIFMDSKLAILSPVHIVPYLYL